MHAPCSGGRGGRRRAVTGDPGAQLRVWMGVGAASAVSAADHPSRRSGRGENHPRPGDGPERSLCYMAYMMSCACAIKIQRGDVHVAHVSCVCELCRARSGARAAQQRLATGPRGPLYRAGGWRGGTPRPRPPPTALPRRGAMGDGARRGETAAIAGYRRERSTGAGDGLRAVFANVPGSKPKPRCSGTDRAGRE